MNVAVRKKFRMVPFETVGRGHKLSENNPMHSS